MGRYMYKKTFRRFKKSAEFRAAGGRCAYCGIKLERKNATKDHFIPKAAGGLNTKDNLVPACFSCNQAKGKLNPAEIG